MRLLKRRILAPATLSLVGVCPFFALHAQECVWAGKVYADSELKKNGQVCQVCQAGKWIDNDTSCERCYPKLKPKDTNPAPTDSDCTAQRSPIDPQKLTFSDGARVHQADGAFQMCSAGIWSERTPAGNQICGDLDSQSRMSALKLESHDSTFKFALSRFTISQLATQLLPTSHYTHPGENWTLVASPLKPMPVSPDCAPPAQSFDLGIDGDARIPNIRLPASADQRRLGSIRLKNVR